MTEKQTIPFGGFLTCSLGDRFSMVRKMADKVEVEEGFLPGKISFGIESEEEGKRLHGVAVNLWQDMFKEEEFVETLMQINQNLAAYTPEIHQKLKVTRIGTVILRDANRLFSESHLNPESFYKFTKILGVFNDNFGTDIAEPSVGDVLAAMRESQEGITKQPFVFCSPASLEDYLKMENNLIMSYLGKGVISREMLHDLKRTSRRFLNLSLLKMLHYPDMESFRVYAYLRKINTIFGDCLDECTNGKATGEPENLIKVPEIAEELLSKFLARVVWSR